MHIQFIQWLVGALVTQALLNVISRKINYSYGKKREVIALFVNVSVYAVYYPLFHVSNGINLNILILALIAPIVISISLIDFKYYEIPNEYSLAIAILGVIWMIKHGSTWHQWLLGAIIGFVVYLVLMIFSRGNLGGGDVKLAGALGFIMGTHFFMTWIMVTFFSGAMISLVLLGLKLKSKEDKIAFGPYICFAYLFATLLMV